MTCIGTKFPSLPGISFPTVSLAATFGRRDLKTREQNVHPPFYITDTALSLLHRSSRSLSSAPVLPFSLTPACAPCDLAVFRFWPLVLKHRRRRYSPWIRTGMGNRDKREPRS